MRSEKGASDKATAADNAAGRPYHLAVVSPSVDSAPSQDATEQAAREWDPYHVWRRRVRPDSDAA